jgi:hypothetical protein
MSIFAENPVWANPFGWFEYDKSWKVGWSGKYTQTTMNKKDQWFEFSFIAFCAADNLYFPQVWGLFQADEVLLGPDGLAQRAML